MRISKTISYAEMASEGIEGAEAIHRRLVEEHGPGLFEHRVSDDKSGIAYTFEYAERVGEGNHSLPLIDGELLEAIRIARINMCNMSAVKQDPDGIYSAIDPDDECAAGKCISINRLEEFLNHPSNRGR